jgi:circadian clock protein KaiC
MESVLASGVEGLDYILHGGIQKGSSILVEGAPGTGKTTLGLQFIYYGAVHCDEPGIYITFEELPEQIYKDAMSFGWDLRQLEKRDQLRVVCMSPNVLLEQMMEPNGIFEQMVNQIRCKRVVIDSISLLKYGASTGDQSQRQSIYSMINILRKMSLTAILIREQSYLDVQEFAFENYVADGVIHLALKEHLEQYRKRTLEVLKMRGSKIIEGEHIYYLTEKGMHLVPVRSMVEDKIVVDDGQNISTGITSLDQLLSGGISRGSVFILDTNSKANYKYILASITSSRIRVGEKVVILPSSLLALSEYQKLLQLYDVNLEEEVRQKNVYFIEHYKRHVSPEFESAVIDVNGLSDEEYKQVFDKKLNPLIQEGLNNGEHWFVYYDLNTIVTERGTDYVTSFFTEEAAKARELGVTILALCNFKEIGEKTSAFLERTSNGVIRTQVDGSYQYIQVTKSPYGRMSRPYLVENISEKPFIRLV